MTDDTIQRDAIDPAVLQWLREHGPRLKDPIRTQLIAGGRSNLTYRIEDGEGRVLALRRPPLGEILAGAHDVAREWTWISGIHGTAVPVAPPVALSDDRDITPYDFYLTEFIDGIVLGDLDAAAQLTPRARTRASEETIDVLAHLHALDPDTVGAPRSRSTDGYIERQLRGWTRQISQVEFAEAALLGEGGRRLGLDIPRQTTGITHGDYRPGNIIYAPDGTVRAVLDWELAARGDVLADLGWLLSSWADGSNSLTPGIAMIEGFPGVDALAERYADVTGRDLSRLDFYVAFAQWRLACIAVGVRHRYLSGVMGDDGFDPETIGRQITELGHAVLTGLPAGR